MGVAINERPELSSTALRLRTFADVLTTMRDESIPLTTGEPTAEPAGYEYYDYMKSYSPYDKCQSAGPSAPAGDDRRTIRKYATCQSGNGKLRELKRTNVCCCYVRI